MRAFIILIIVLVLLPASFKASVYFCYHICGQFGLRLRHADYARQPSTTNSYESFPHNAYNPDHDIQNVPAASNVYSAPAVGPAEFEKEYFTFFAPEAEFNDHNNPQFNSELKRGLRVIFIKGPENSGLENAAIKLAKSAAEQRTAIYVLSKQADVGDLTNKLNALKKNNGNKPEVHYVKYRTPADADSAQRAIQYQYDGLNGQSSNHDVAVAHVLDFAFKGSTSSNSFAPAEPANAYLPLSKFV